LKGSANANVVLIILRGRVSLDATVIAQGCKVASISNSAQRERPFQFQIIEAIRLDSNKRPTI